MKKNYFKKSLSVMFSLLLLVFSLFGSQTHGMFAAGGVASSALLLTKGLSACLRSRIGGSG